MKLKKFDRIPKSCYKANLHALMFIAECKKRNMNVSKNNKLIEYFLKRNIFYKSDLSGLIIDEHIGWRNVDIFFPYEVMRVGLINILEAFSALGYGDDPKLKDAWDILYKHTDEYGRVILDGTLTKSYLPKEKVGSPSKWATFYALLAEYEKQLYK